MPLEERERVRPLVLVEPGAVPELDERGQRVEERCRGGELGERRARLDEARRVLEQDAAELPGPLERLERLAEGGERRLAVRLAVAGHLSARLRVEDEAGGGALGPLRRRLG